MTIPVGGAKAQATTTAPIAAKSASAATARTVTKGAVPINNNNASEGYSESFEYTGNPTNQKASNRTSINDVRNFAFNEDGTLNPDMAALLIQGNGWGLANCV